MKGFYKLIQWVYIFWVGFVFTFFMILFLPFLTLPFIFGFGQIGYFFLWLWSWIFSLLTFIRYEKIGQDRIPKNKAFIYVSNHTSFLDLPGIRMTIPGEFRPLAKKELLKIPVFGWIAKTATIIVDRTSAESKRTSIERLKKILAQGISILIFAEGTQNRSKELLQPFHDGAFRVSIDTGQPILTMVVVGAGKLMPPGTINLRPGKIKIIVGEVFDPAGLSQSDLPAWKEKVRNQMAELIRTHTAGA